MLREIRCDKFRNGFVLFGPSLNVILGDENATNSIGKSTLLMVIDFAFGGDTLVTHNKDIVTELGDHDYFFIFEFGGEKLHFRRGTFEPGIVFVCDDANEVQRPISVDQYTATLKLAYEIDLPDITFRSLVGLYSRVWGKPNLLVERPLHIVAAQSARECVDTLVKTFNLYSGIRERTATLHKLESDVTAQNSAERNNLVPKVTKTQYAKTQVQIENLERDLEDIRKNLASYATNISAIINKEVLTLKLRKDDILLTRMNVAGRLQRVEKNLTNNRALHSKNFQELNKFFPDVNKERIDSIEAFHSGVAKILKEQLQESKDQLANELSQIDATIAHIDAEMAAALGSVEKPEALVDYVFNVAVSLHSAKTSSENYERATSTRAAVKVATEALQGERESILRTVESIVNDGMRRIVTAAMGEQRKSPRLALSNGGYTFEVYDDTGTGTAYVGLVLFDLTVFHATQLPTITHDSILFKNIENDSVAGLIDVYMKTAKQSFIALDEIEKYGEAAAKLLRSRSVIQLSDREVLYVRDWRRDG